MEPVVAVGGVVGSAIEEMELMDKLCEWDWFPVADRAAGAAVVFTDIFASVMSVGDISVVENFSVPRSGKDTQ